jgi:uncharacterized protein RhaS with RHS repeats
LYHVGAREYDPRTARWLQRDPIDAASGDPNLYRYAGNDPVNQADPEGLDAAYARKIVCRYRKLIKQVADVVGIPAELLAGVVYNETYGGRMGEIISDWHEINNFFSILKFIDGQPASVGITQVRLDPSKIQGCNTREGRSQFILKYNADIYLQLVLAAAKLRELINRPNRYPGRSGQLTAREMAVILTEYNIGPTNTPAAKARPNEYGQRFMRSLKTIKNLLVGKGCEERKPNIHYGGVPNRSYLYCH